MGAKPAPVIDKPGEVSGSSEEYRKTIDTIPILAWSSLPDGSHEFHNQRWQAFTGLSAEQSQGSGWVVAIHPDDKGRLMEARRASMETGIAGEVEARLRRFDGTYRWFLFRVEPLRNQNGRLMRWCGTATDIEDRKRAEDFLAGEKRALEMVARGDPLPAVLDAMCRLIEELCSGSLCGILLVDAGSNCVEHAAAPRLPTDYNEAIHGSFINPHAGPCGMATCLKTQVIASDIASDTRWDDDWRALALSHGLRACWSTPIVASDRAVLGTFAIYWREPRGPTEQHQRILEQITHLAAVAIERTRTEAALEESEERFRLIVDSIPGLVCTMTAAGEVELVNRQVLEYFGRTLEELKTWATTDAVHPDDHRRVTAAWRRSIATGQPYEIEHRIRRADGVYRWFKMRALPVRNADGRIIRWYGLLTDIDDRKKAEEKLRQDEEELRRMTDAIPQHIIVLAPDGTAVYANQSTLDYTGLRLEDVTAANFRSRVFHPEDVERVRDERAKALARGLPFENEQRVRRRDGRYRWTLIRYNPFRDELGRAVRWYATGTDIHDRKEAEERTRNENLALREEIDGSSMFEEIVGSSEALRKVLVQVSKVAHTDSTVLILGETGTGKELIARAIHRQSNRAGRAFIRVNCAAIPPSLIASELFGYEKGAFTGALQRRLGRFESADGGTIFLDEIGELPPEAQIALLRVLQEREFERVGSNQPISVDVRVLAASNRDLAAAVASGTFRRDLFYRLNVFPIRLPPLRERTTDIPLLAEYLIGRYAKKAGKSIRSVSRQTIQLLRAYDWPGNVRELQNVMERAVILCEGDTLSVDATWLKRETPGPVRGDATLAASLLDREREMIESALVESRGVVAGPKGAAIKLGIPRQTLDSKIKSLQIDKHRFRAAAV